MKPPGFEGKCPNIENPDEETKDICVGLGATVMMMGATGAFETSPCVMESASRYITSPNEDARKTVTEYFSSGMGFDKL